MAKKTTMRYLWYFQGMQGNGEEVFAPLFTGVMPISKNSTLSFKEGDAVFFAGGTDVSSELYFEPRGQYSQSPNVYRDAWETYIFRVAMAKKMKIIGVCRGAQLTTVMAGGRLIQHVDGHLTDHFMRIPDEKREIKVTSTHHQMMFPYELAKDEFEIIGHSTDSLSKRYLNGHGKEVSLPKNFVEPEIVWYPHINAMAIQGHPEYVPDKNGVFPKFCRDLVDAYLLND